MEMTDIDIKRLEWDADYWDAVAPLGATHYWGPSGEWYQDCGDYVLAWHLTGRNWQAALAPLRITTDAAIPRPTKQEQEGGDHVKHVGMRFQASLGECELMAIDSNGVTCCVKMDDGGHLQFCSLDALMPIKPQHERQREELVEVVEAEMENCFHKAVTAGDIADAILSKYHLEPKP